MRLSEFIIRDMESILAEFEHFARTHTAAGVEMDMSALRDHAAAILTAVAEDLEQPQTAAEQTSKSRGEAPAVAGTTAAEHHGTDRAASGFSLEEMFAEYRALRASVLRLWTAAHGALEDDDVQDLIRFNEAIDQALAESIRRYSTSIDHSREMFLAVLGHDLRSPISAIVTGAGFLEGNAAAGGPVQRMAGTIRASGERMDRLVGDLLDFTLTRLGRGIPVDAAEVDVGEIARGAIEEACAMHPEREFRLDASGDLRSRVDPDRLGQVLANLFGNAIQHGDTTTPVVARVEGAPSEIRIVVQNAGAVMPPEDRRHIFDPFRRLAPDRTARADRRSMGLGLYITQQIVSAHGGDINVESDEKAGTTFTVRLPRA